MQNLNRQSGSISTAQAVLNGIAHWVRNYRYSLGLHNQLAQCGPDEVMRVASDFGLTTSSLSDLARKGPEAADLLRKMLIALKVDPNVIAATDLQTMRDLQRLCITCSEKGRCLHELDEGTARANFREFCPNAFTLEEIFGQKSH